MWPAVNAAVDLVSLRVAHPLGDSSRETSESQLTRLIGSRCGVIFVKEREDEVGFRRRRRVHARFKVRETWRRGQPVALVLCLRGIAAVRQCGRPERCCQGT